MATLRVRFKLNPGREGVVLGKLSKQAASIEVFLRALAADLGQDSSPNLWLASKFKNGSVENDVEYRAVVDAASVTRFNEAIEVLSRFMSGPTVKVPSYVSAATIDSFAGLRQNLDPDETMGVAVYNPESGRQKPFRYVDRVQLEEIAATVETEMVYIGAVMGRTHEWNKGAEKPYIIIRDINTSELVRCNYVDADYSKVVSIFKDKSAVVSVQGTIRFHRITGKTEVLMASDFEVMPDLTDADFEAFFGCADGMTGGLSAAEYIKRGREE